MAETPRSDPFDNVCKWVLSSRHRYLERWYVGLILVTTVGALVNAYLVHRLPNPTSTQLFIQWLATAGMTLGIVLVVTAIYGFVRSACEQRNALRDVTRFNIVGAVYGSYEHGYADVTEAVRSRVHANRLKFSVTNPALVGSGDPAKNFGKTLTIYYLLRGIPLVAYFYENSDAVLP